VGIEKAWGLLTAKLLGWMREFILLLPNLAVAVAVQVGFWLLAKLARNLLARLLRRISHSEQVNKLLAQAIYIALIAAGFFVALGILDLQKTLASLLAGAGILGLALGFAFQDIAANFMAGIYLSIEHPFRPGHLIRSKDIQGIVQRIRLRWTEIVAPEGQLLLVPNKQVFENPITNFTTSGKRRVDLKAGIGYGDDLETARRVGIAAIEQVSTRTENTQVEFFFEEFAESTINFVVRFWIPFVAKQADYLRAKSEAIERLKRAFDENGISMPSPIRTIEFAAPGRGDAAQPAAEGSSKPSPDLVSRAP
jgi:small conductance mechanosensitive channel